MVWVTTVMNQDSEAKITGNAVDILGGFWYNVGCSFGYGGSRFMPEETRSGGSVSGPKYTQEEKK